MNAVNLVDLSLPRNTSAAGIIARRGIEERQGEQSVDPDADTASQPADRPGGSVHDGRVEGLSLKAIVLVPMLRLQVK